MAGEDPSPKSAGKEGRKARLAEALKRNLKRRKTQAKSRQQQASPQSQNPDRKDD